MSRVAHTAFEIGPRGTAPPGECEQALARLLRYCRSHRWAGYDPYDGLTSPLSKYLPGKTARTLFTQLVKRSPLNLRRLLGIKPGLNAKGIALALRAVILLSRRYQVDLRAEFPILEDNSGASDEAVFDGLAADFNLLIRALESLRSPGFGEACWGYSFDWQSRAFFAPRGTPNVVCTSFAAHAFLDWYESTKNVSALDIAKSSCEFLVTRLNRSEDATGHCFSYTPFDDSRVHNVNLLAAELLARVFGITGEAHYREAAERAASYSVARQSEDGSWVYGEAGSQQWIDSFHTGFVLVSLKHLIDELGAGAWLPALMRGFQFYRERFFLADCTPGYYHNRLHPIDVHSAAQAIITFREMTDLTPEAGGMAHRAVEWAVTNMQDPEGFFYFQKRRFYTNKTAFMRWSQAWMLYALSLFISRSPVREDG